MTITIQAKPLEIEAELPGYGKFYVRRLGAALEAEIQDRIQKAEEDNQAAQDKYKPLIEKELELTKTGKAEELAALKETDEYKEATKARTACAKSLIGAYNFAKREQLKLWRSDDPEALKKMFNDFSTEQIMDFYNQVIRSELNA